jgi:hypothetical protein
MIEKSFLIWHTENMRLHFHYATTIAKSNTCAETGLKKNRTKARAGQSVGTKLQRHYPLFFYS